MILFSSKYGKLVEVVVQVERSAVDSYIYSAYSTNLDRDLTNEELDNVQYEFEAEIQQYAYENGSRNHN